MYLVGVDFVVWVLSLIPGLVRWVGGPRHAQAHANVGDSVTQVHQARLRRGSTSFRRFDIIETLMGNGNHEMAF